MKKITILIILLFIPFFLFSAEFEFNYGAFKTVKKEGNDIIETEHTYYRIFPGEPMLPVEFAYIIIPFGKDVKKIHSEAKTVELEGKYDIPPIAPEMTTSDRKSISEKNIEIYSKNQFFPSQNYKKLGIQRKNGVDILIVQLYPFQYNPVTKKLIHNKKVKLTVDFVNNPANEEGQIRKLLTFDKLSNLFSEGVKENKLFLNKSALYSYQDKSCYYKSSKGSLVSSDNPYDYIIITRDSLKDAWSNFLTHKSGMGLRDTLYTVEDIYSNYTGYDNQGKVRNFIIDAYDTWSGTEHPLQWVLLGGDSGVVPSRQVRVDAYYNSAWHHNNIYSDGYYAALDSTWDNDNDHIYGEGDHSQHPQASGMAGEEVDWFSEIYIGRASLENHTEIANWVNKTTSYENLSCSESYLKTSTLIGEHLSGSIYGKSYQNEIALYLPDFNHNKLYDKDGTYSKANVVSAINNGTNIISHIGHASYTHVFGMYDGDVDTLLTSTDYCLIYTQGCNTGNFVGHNCIAESFIEKEHGAYAYFGNTSYGFYSTYKEQSSSQYLNREFFDAIINEGKTNLGKANADSKEDLVGIIGAVGTRRYVAIEFTLFGDPHLSLHKDIKDVSAEQTASDEVAIHYEDTPGTGADSINNYKIYERDDTTSTISIQSITKSEHDVTLTLQTNIKEGIPYNVKISNVSGIVNPTIRPIKTISNIVELSIITPTIWTSAESPYYMYDDLIITSHLTIQSGTVVKFNQGKGIVVFDGGWLKAIGTSDNPVYFVPYSYPDSASNGDWADITFWRDADYSNCELDHCLIKYATTGVWIDSLATPTVRNCQIYHTKEYGIYSYFANPTVENVVVAYANSSSKDYGFYFDHSNSNLKNIVSYGNDNYGIYAGDYSNISIKNSVIFGNNGGQISNDSSTVNVTYSDIEGDYAGTGNINSNPLFTDASNNDFSFQSTSPCIDTGDPNSTVPEGGGLRIDMGAEEYTDNEVTKSVTSGDTCSFGPSKVEMEITLGNGQFTVTHHSISHPNAPNSISRYATINLDSGSPTVDLRLHYEDSELNGQDEDSLKIWKYSNGSWTKLVPDNRDTVNNWVERDSISSFSDFVLSDAGDEGSLPVELSSFTAQLVDNVPTLYWTTQSETDNLGWNVYRAKDNNIFANASRINQEMISGYSTTSEAHDYFYADNIADAVPGDTYWYWLEGIDLGGGIHHYDTTTKLVIPDDYDMPMPPELPIKYGLYQNVPNPFYAKGVSASGGNSAHTPITRICFNLHKSSFVKIDIYNIRGEFIKCIYKKYTEFDSNKPKPKVTYWDGCDENGMPQLTGIYLYRLSTENSSEVRKMLLIK